jgi:hypothetical protein
MMYDIVGKIKNSFAESVIKVKGAIVKYKLNGGKNMIRDLVNCLFAASAEITDDIGKLGHSITEDVVKSPELVKLIAASGAAGKMLTDRFKTDIRLKTAMELAKLASAYSISGKEPAGLEPTIDSLIFEAKKLVDAGKIDEGFLDFIKETKSTRYDILKGKTYDTVCNLSFSAKDVAYALRKQMTFNNGKDDFVVLNRTISIKTDDLYRLMTIIEKDLEEAGKEEQAYSG